MENDRLINEVDLAKNFRRAIEPYISEDLKGSAIFVDLSDIYAICLSYVALIDSHLISKGDEKINKESLVGVLYEIDSELVEHLSFHLESLKENLPLVIEQIEKYK